MTDIREGLMTDNAAVLDGYTREVEGRGIGGELFLLIKPDTDLDGSFKAWDMDEQRLIRVNGWFYSFAEVPPEFKLKPFPPVQPSF